LQTHLALQKYFERKKKSSPGFSLRALARRVGVSPSFLSRIMSGKKSIPDNLLKKLARVLDVEPELLAGASPTKRKQKTVVTSPVDDWAISRKETAQILRNWYYVAILEFTTLQNYDGKIETIARRLRLSTQTVEIALREMLSLGLVNLEKGRYKKSDEKIRFTSSTSTHLIRKFHDDILERCQLELRNATTEEEFQKRLIAGVMVTCTPEAAQSAKRKLADCIYEIANELTANPGTEVYHLGAVFFPLTKDDI